MGLEVWENIDDNGLIDLLIGLTGALLFIIALLIFFSTFWRLILWSRSQVSAKNLLTKKKKAVDGSLGYNAFPKSINNTEIAVENNQKPSNLKIAFKVLIDKSNILNFLMVFLIAFSFGYNQIFRSMLFFRLSTFDSKKILKNRFFIAYTNLAKIILIAVILLLLAYFYSISDIFFKEENTEIEYTWDHCYDFWT